LLHGSANIEDLSISEEILEINHIYKCKKHKNQHYTAASDNNAERKHTMRAEETPLLCQQF